MGLFSGDGTGCAARLLKKYGAKNLGGVQIKMPDSVCDSKLLKKSAEENRQIVKRTDQRIEQIAGQIRRGQYPQEGLSLIAHIKGLFGQRLWFYRKTSGYADSLEENANASGAQYNRVLTTEDFDAVWKIGTLLPDNIYIMFLGKAD